MLIARGAMWNASIFRKEGMLPVYDVAKRYLEIAQQYNNRFANSKYCILEVSACLPCLSLTVPVVRSTQSNTFNMLTERHVHACHA